MDLNHRPLGYEGKSTPNSLQHQPIKPKRILGMQDQERTLFGPVLFQFTDRTRTQGHAEFRVWMAAFWGKRVIYKLLAKIRNFRGVGWGGWSNRSILASLGQGGDDGKPLVRCSFFLSRSILGNDNVLYRSLPGSATFRAEKNGPSQLHYFTPITDIVKLMRDYSRASQMQMRWSEARSV